MKIKIAELVMDAGTQIRAEVSQATVAEYAEQYRLKQKMPPVVAFSSNGSPKILADGFHRVMGATEAGLESIEVDLRKGDRLAAIKFALSANAKHGLRRTIADKVNAVKVASTDFPDLNNQQICALCDVSDDFVRKHRVGESPAKKAPKKAGGPPPKSPTSAKPAASGPPPKSAPPAEEDQADLQEQQSKEPAETPRKRAKLDRTGHPIPDEIMTLWQEAEEVQGQLGYCSSLRGILKLVQEKKNPAWVEVNFSTLHASINQLYEELKLVKPHAVCPTCQGLAAKDCTSCKGRGFVSEFYWSTCVPEETKNIRAGKATK